MGTGFFGMSSGLLLKTDRITAAFSKHRSMSELNKYDSPVDSKVRSHAPLYKCYEREECDSSFGSQQSLDQHLNFTAHVFECDECDRLFGT
jgi:hypothetical protein